MNRVIVLSITLISFLFFLVDCTTQKQNPDEPIQAFSIDFNQEEGGPNAFSKPGLWADANPAEHVKWYKDMEGVEAVQNMVGEKTRLNTCLANWNNQDPMVVVPNAIKAGVGLYGFTKPMENSLLPPIENYLTSAVDSLHGDDKNIAVLARVYNGYSVDIIK